MGWTDLIHAKARTAVLGVIILSVFAGCGQTVLTPRQQAKESFQSGDWQAAVTATSQLLQASPDDIQLLTWRGQSHIALSQHKKAIADFSRIIELSPRDSEGYYLRQLAFRRAGMEDLAAADGNQAREMDPKYKTAYKYDPSNFVSGIDPALLTPKNNETEPDADEAKPAKSRREQRKEKEQLARQESQAAESDENPFDASSSLKQSPEPANTSLSGADASKVHGSDHDSKTEPESMVTREERPTADFSQVAEPEPNAREDFATVPTNDPPKSSDGLPKLKEVLPSPALELKLGALADDELDPKNNPAAEKNLIAPRSVKVTPKNNFVPPKPPPVSTAIPNGGFNQGIPGSNGQVGVYTGVPQSQPITNQSPGLSGPRTTGLSSRPSTLGIPGIVAGNGFNNGATGLTSNPNAVRKNGVQPGQFSGNTIHVPGSKPVLSTSIGSMPKFGPRVIPGTNQTPRSQLNRPGQAQPRFRQGIPQRTTQIPSIVPAQ